MDGISMIVGNFMPVLSKPANMSAIGGCHGTGGTQQPQGRHLGEVLDIGQ